MPLPQHPYQDGCGTIASELVERRRDPRKNQPAPVTVYIQGSGQNVKFQAVLVNSSRGGFAIRHWRKELMLGTHVKACFADGEQVVARVKWNWISGPLVISGLEQIPEGGLKRPLGESIGNFQRGAHSATLAWAVAALAALVIIVGWCLKAKLL